MVKGLLLYAAGSRRLSSVGQYPVDVTTSYPASKAKEVCPRSATVERVRTRTTLTNQPVQLGPLTPSSCQLVDSLIETCSHRFGAIMPWLL
ncbi:MAG: hypothetical protein Q9161_008985 [Pseudevernia consocians]